MSQPESREKPLVRLRTKVLPPYRSGILLPSIAKVQGDFDKFFTLSFGFPLRRGSRHMTNFARRKLTALCPGYETHRCLGDDSGLANVGSKQTTEFPGNRFAHPATSAFGGGTAPHGPR